MKKNIAVVISILAGSTVGYFVGKIGDASGVDLFLEIYYGAALFFVIQFAILEAKDYGIIAGAVLGLLISLSLDLIAGSTIDTRNKLSLMCACAFTGWAFWHYRKSLLVGGLIGGVVGFVWGLADSHYFGKVCLPPGYLNASLLAVQISLIGMLLASLFMKLVGWKFMGKRNPPS